MDSIAAFAQHVADRRFDDFPLAAVAAAKTFVLDTLGVGIAGSCGPRTAELIAAQRRSGAGTCARVWSTGERLAAPAAALCNAYQVHNSEFDCVHEAAVAHVMSVVLPVALAGAERAGGVDGRRLIEAVVLGVDVAASLGVAARSGLRFFRPATVGAFGATAALAKLEGLSQQQTEHAFSIAYGQLSGTMQAHTEGSMLLALQMGFSARNAIVAVDLAAAGIEGPHEILEGRFGYFKLFEPAGDPAAVVRELGRTWRITEVSHKPFPSGRATHGIVDACLELKALHGFHAGEIDSVVAEVPPLVQHLVGRAPRPDMEINYARLCAAYVAARALRRGNLGADDFTSVAYADPETQDLARRVSIRTADLGDPNALAPVTVEITLRDGRRVAQRVDAVSGSPAKPMTRDAHLKKFRDNAMAGRRPVAPVRAERAIALVDRLEELPDVAELVDCIAG